MDEHNKIKTTEGYFKTPNAIFDNESLDLNIYELAVLIYIYRCSNQGADAYPGYSKIAKRCRISKTTARTAILNLEEKDFITVKRRPKSNKDNWPNLYKIKRIPISCDDTGVSGNDTGAILCDATPISCGDTYKELPINNPTHKEPKKNDLDQFFEKVWELYPNKIGKGKIKAATKRNLYQLGFETLTKCIERYKDTKEDWKAWQHGSTFFNSGYIDYLDENYGEVKRGGTNSGSNKEHSSETENRATRKDDAYYRRGFEDFYS